MTPSSDQAHERIARFWEARAREDPLRFSIPGGGATDGEPFTDSAERLLEVAKTLVGWDPTGAELALDLGCGAGRITGALARRATAVVACDISPTMLESARERHATATNVSWHEAAADQLDFLTTGTVDTAIVLGVLGHLPTVALIGPVLEELARVLRPDATVLFDVRTGPPTLELPGEQRAPAHVASHPVWRGTPIDLETLDATAFPAGLLLEQIEGSGGSRCLVLARRSG